MGMDFSNDNRGAPAAQPNYEFVDDVFPVAARPGVERSAFEGHIGSAQAAETYLVRTFNLDRVGKQWQRAKASHQKGHEAKAALRVFDAGLAAGAGAGKAASLMANAFEPVSHSLPAIVGTAVPILPIKIAAALWEAGGNGFLAFTRRSRGLPQASRLRAKLGAMQAGWGLAGVAVSLAAGGASVALGCPILAPWVALGAGEAFGVLSRWRLDRLKKATAEQEGEEIKRLGWHEMGWHPSVAAPGEASVDARQSAASPGPLIKKGPRPS